MCRWVVWCSGADAPILLNRLVFEPSNSLVRQAFNGGFHPGAKEDNNATLNADGFGVGWFSSHGGAAIFRSLTPAWNNRNLRELCNNVESHTIFAHVRAATPGSVVNEENCHPFRFGRLLMQHNGHLEGLRELRRALIAQLSDEAFEWVQGVSHRMFHRTFHRMFQVQGTTDSELIFALFITQLDAPARTTPFEPGELRRAAVLALARLRSLLRECHVYERHPEGYSTMNWAISDGRTVIVTRYCDKASDGIPPPSLYYSFKKTAEVLSELEHGAKTASEPPCTHAPKSRPMRAPPSPCAASRECTAGAFVCASEPLCTVSASWYPIRENTALSIEGSIKCSIECSVECSTGTGISSERTPCCASSPARGSAKTNRRLSTRRGSRATNAPTPRLARSASSLQRRHRRLPCRP